jgi:hypothetical protein
LVSGGARKRIPRPRGVVHVNLSLLKRIPPIGAKFLSHFANALIMKAICIQLVLLRSSRKRNKKRKVELRLPPVVAFDGRCEVED